MNTALRIDRKLLAQVHKDLNRPHAFAFERVGFLACRTAAVEAGVLLLAHEYLPVADEDYDDEPAFGATMGSDAIRKALQHALNNDVAMVHVHRHEHRGVPRFSGVDIVESAKFVPDFWKVRAGVPHGALVLSHDAMYGTCWDPKTRLPVPISQYSIVGRPLGLVGRWWK